jgi:hypothetical protein
VGSYWLLVNWAGQSEGRIERIVLRREHVPRISLRFAI